MSKARAAHYPWQQPTDSPWREARQVIDHLIASGYQAVFVGGCVRDSVLGQACHDCDIASSATSSQIESLFPHTIPVGRAFGVVVVCYEGQHFEVSTFRQDGIYQDGRRPLTVDQGDEISDVGRRDFTINALIADPHKAEIRDYVGGMKDLQDACLRVVGDPFERLHEDRLRILRAIRFAARFQLQIDPKSAQALHTVRPSGLSRERIWEEWDKSLALKERSLWWSLLCSYHCLEYFIPVSADEEMRRTLARALESSASALVAEALIFCCCFPSISHLTDWLADQPISKQRRQKIIAIQELLHQWNEQRTLLEKKRLSRSLGAEEAYCCLQALGQEQAAQALQEHLGEAQRSGPIPRLIDGRDLQAEGILPGPIYAEILSRIEDAWLLGSIQNRDQALAALREMSFE